MHATRRRARAFVLRAAPAACALRSRAVGPRASLRAPLPIARADYPQPTGVQMNSDDSSRLPLAGATLRIDTPSASCAPASVPAFTDPQPIAPDATRRGALVRR
ncbi:hypothetical protein A8D95_29500 [Burkholderia cenocepacia]|uniref:Uncharacterized protein n=2 Tax=Burkholderia cenocepacia TaxID=95486 RepID=A0A1V2VU98_9BURK|nr:hypothetical protein A8D83_32945 [Burkholderia cenocepacia]ONJ22620.1 hypothetical protein A8D90_27810 [Burkholderia cenocepacia]ONP19216.1 hypothetical protein A8D84_33135 [Burkholderia cenocepacia]ONP30269.1 hypothetical protein A8D85_32735 [Burkholderia cenocepacia]ONP41276.1 hypothetical protein A8D87_30515 [Burkholderia cenocepacia]